MSIIATRAAAADAAEILADPDARPSELTAAQSVIDSYNTRLPIVNLTVVEFNLRGYINRRQQQDRYGKSL